MPVSLGAKISGKPSRSYLGSGTFSETGSLVSYRSGQDGSLLSYRANGNSFGASGSAQGSPPGSPSALNSRQSSPLKSSLRRGSRGDTASDAGGAIYNARSPVDRSPSIASRLLGGRLGNASSPSRQASIARRSVTFSDSDQNDSLIRASNSPAGSLVPYSSMSGGKPNGIAFGRPMESMSDLGGYLRPSKKRTPSILSDQGSVTSDTGSVSRMRGSKTDRIATSQSLMGSRMRGAAPIAINSSDGSAWRRSLGGQGAVLRSSASSSTFANNSPPETIVPRRSTIRKSALDLSEPQPSRRYSMQVPAASTSTAATAPTSPLAKSFSASSSVVNGNVDLLVPPPGRSSRKDDDDRSISSASSSRAGSERSTALRTTIHSHHSKRQLKQSGLDRPTDSGFLASHSHDRERSDLSQTSTNVTQSADTTFSDSGLYAGPSHSQAARSAELHDAAIDSSSTLTLRNRVGQPQIADVQHADDAITEKVC